MTDKTLPRPGPNDTRRSRIRAAVAWFIPPEVQRGDPDTLRRAWLVIAYDVALICAAVFYTTVLAEMGSPLGALMMGTGTVIAIFVPYVMRRTGSAVIAGNVLVALFFGVLTAVAYRLGGHGAAPLWWYAAVPAVALSTSGRRSALIWAGVTAVSLGTFYALSYSAYCLPNDLTDRQRDFIGLLASPGLVAIILALTYLYEVFKDRVAQHLRQSEERFRLAAQSITDVVWEWDIVTGQLDWFGDVDSLLGYATEESPCTIEAWEALVDPEDHDRVMAALDRHCTADAPFDEEYRIRRKDGGICHWQARGAAVRDS